MRQKSNISQHILRPPTYTRHTYTPQMFIYHTFHMYGTHLDLTNVYIPYIPHTHSAYLIPPYSTHSYLFTHSHLIYSRPCWHIHSQIHIPHIHGPTHNTPYTPAPLHIYTYPHIQHIYNLPFHIYQTVHIPYTHMPTYTSTPPTYILHTHIHTYTPAPPTYTPTHAFSFVSQA